MIELDTRSAVPPYEQVRAQFAHQIATGQLAVGTRLPTVRQLAADLGLAINTVARAYRELEAAGLVLTRGRAGTFVHTGDAALARVGVAARTYADVARSTGLGVYDAVRMVRTAFDEPRST